MSKNRVLAYLEKLESEKTNQLDEVQQETINEEKEPEKKVFLPGQHVIYKRYLLNTEYPPKDTYNQVEVPEGYQVLHLESYIREATLGTHASATKGFFIWFINNKRVEVEPVVSNNNPLIYEYSAPGRVIETMIEEKGPELKLTP